jgi:hypothetical protein
MFSLYVYIFDKLFHAMNVSLMLLASKFELRCPAPGNLNLLKYTIKFLCLASPG